MQKTSLSSLLLTLCLTTLSACGGGASNSAVPPPQPSMALLTLSTAATGSIPANTTINSYDATVTLPPGVTVMTMMNSSAMDTNDLTVTNNNAGASIIGVYTAATGTYRGKVKVYVDSPVGLTVGDFCKLRVTVAPGSSAPASSFGVTLDDATGINAVTASTVLGLQTALSTTIR